jgi:hypothetical protein
MSILLASALLAASTTAAGLGSAVSTQAGSEEAVQPPPVYKMTGSRVAVGRDIHVTADEEVTNAVVVIGGSLRVDGRVRDGILVVGGDVHLGPTADVRGDVALVGGQLTRENNSRLVGSVSYVSFGEWTRLVNFQWWPALDFGGLGRWLGLAATISRISILAVLMLVIVLVARAPVARVGRAAAADPFRAAVVGLTAEVLFIPLVLIFSVALGITIIGLPIVALLIPLAMMTAVTALLLGYTALACRIGEWAEARLGWKPHSAVIATVVGLFLIVGPTLLARMLDVAPAPLHAVALTLLIAGAVVEFVVWTIGLGATLLTGFGRFNPAEA